MAGTPTSPLAPPLPGHALTAASTTAPWCGTGAQDHHQARCPSIGKHIKIRDPAYTLDGRKLFWKIDYYDAACVYGSEDPADPSQTTRVLTIMLVEEY
jgi:hypothetical protein